MQADVALLLTIVDMLAGQLAAEAPPIFNTFRHPNARAHGSPPLLHVY